VFCTAVSFLKLGLVTFFGKELLAQNLVGEIEIANFSNILQAAFLQYKSVFTALFLQFGFVRFWQEKVGKNCS